jgi:hypothetical protein
MKGSERFPLPVMGSEFDVADYLECSVCETFREPAGIGQRFELEFTQTCVFGASQFHDVVAKLDVLPNGQQIGSVSEREHDGRAAGD